ncbi:putative isomerase YddE [anaerobic digester metagenome]
MSDAIHTTVFAYQQGGGNPCPVVLGAERYCTEEMQAMAKEFMQETAFVCLPDHPECDFKLRYFVPLHEMEMCVHATIGCATVLVKKGLAVNSPIRFETKLGMICVEWGLRDGDVDVAVAQFLPAFADKNPTVQEVCKALDISAGELGEYPIQSVATSRQKLMVPLKDRETLDHLRPDFEYLWQLCDVYNTTGFYPFAPGQDADGIPVFLARQFPKRAGYDEDPATGVAASALGAYLVRTAGLPVRQGWNSFKILQGFAMGKPSVIISEVLVSGDQITATRIRGSACLV